MHRRDDGAGHAAERARDAGERRAAGTRSAGARAGAATRPRSRPCRRRERAARARAAGSRPARACITPRACLATTMPSSRYSGCVPYGAPDDLRARRAPRARDAKWARTGSGSASRRSRNWWIVARSIGSSAETSQVATASTGTVARRARSPRRGRGSGRARRWFRPRDRRGVDRAGSRPWRSTPTT